ncbi:MAG: hypothetical protein AB1646_08775 [Thermodesulfobacteriota bacterium]
MVLIAIIACNYHYMYDMIDIILQLCVVYMRILTIMTKVTRVLKVSDLVRDITSDTTDEELMEKHSLDWKQLGKIYTRLYHGRYISQETLIYRLEMRGGRDASHIPLADLGETTRHYECRTCGFSSGSHFTNCPRCHEINVRRLTKRRPPGHATSQGHMAPG